VALAGGLLAALLGGYWYVFEYRPWEAHYRGRPTSWWAEEVERASPWDGTVDHPPWLSWLGEFGLPLPERHRPWSALADGEADAVPVLAELVARNPSKHFLFSFVYLARLGAKARPAVPSLLRLLNDSDEITARTARGSLRCIDPAALAAYDREHPQEDRP
jgi:hypothetical protein